MSSKKCEGVKRLHRKRRAQKKCIGNATHGKAYAGGRCRSCWDKKLAAERDRYAKRSNGAGRG